VQRFANIEPLLRDHLMGLDPGPLNYEAQVEARLDALAEHLERYLDLDGLLAVASQAAAA
jgi:cobyric acid synthase